MDSNNLAITEENDNAKLVRQQKIDRARELEDLRLILETPEGTRFFRRFFDDGKMFNSAMTGNSWTYHNEGKRDFVLQYFNDICITCPGKIPELIMRVS
jgi:hypothetical protein